MTTVVFRDGIMASDSGGWCDGVVTRGHRKLVRSSDGVLFGFAGSAGRVSKFITWVTDGGAMVDMPLPAERDGGSDFIALIWSPSDGLSLLTRDGYEDLRGLPYFAIGGGAAVAYGALYHGASAAGAVEAAIAHSDCAVGPVRSIF